MTTLSRKNRFLMLLVGLLAIPVFFPDQPLSPTPVTVPVSGNGPPTTGNWVIGSDTGIRDENYTINGNIIVQNEGNLTLTNVTLWMNCTADGEFSITVNSGGELYLHNCTVTAYNTSNAWLLAANAGSTLLLNTTTVSYAGYELDYPGLQIGTNNAKVINCTMLRNYCGLWLDKANDTLIEDNYITLSSKNGIYSTKANNTILESNSITNSGDYGISLSESGHSTVSGNTLTNCSCGIRLEESCNSTVSGNTLTNCSCGIWLDESGHSTVSGNTLTNSGGIWLDESGHSTVSGNTLLNTSLDGIYLTNSGNSTVCGNMLTNSSSDGIEVSESENSTISGNMIASSSYGGISLSRSGQSTLSGNTLTNNRGDGIYLWNSGNSSVHGNTITNNSGGVGIRLKYTSHSTISGNTVTNNSWNGINLHNSSNNYVSGNTITSSSQYGISLDQNSSNCLLWDNHLATNAEGNAYDGNGTNQWDNGTHGNWYDDYRGLDLNEDGIGDSPYSIGGGLVEDRYPLMNLVLPDTSPPTLDPPADVTYTAGTTGYTITWQPSDANPYWYWILRDGVVIVNATWDGAAITLAVDGLAVGTYNFTVVVLDRLGYRTTDEVLVTVKPAEEETTEEESGLLPGFDLPLVGLVLAVGLLLTRSRRRKRAHS